MLNKDYIKIGDIMYKITICGHFGGSKKFFDGQTIKTKNLYQELVNKYGENQINKIDTYNWKKHPIRLLKKCLNASKNSKNIIILPAHKGVKVFVPLFVHLKRKNKFNLFYAVVGGWLPSYAQKNKRLANNLKIIDKIFVETKGMKKKLEQLKIKNVDILLNFKNVVPTNIKEIRWENKKIIKLCTFSRVIKEKGIENAINIVKIVNNKLGFEYCSLDIYGQISSQYKEEFYKILENSPKYVSYKGMAEADQSIKILSKYDFLLFPTYYSGEGLAGTIIDALSSGTPAIVSNWKYNSEIINNGKNGFLFETKNDKEAANIIIDIFNQKYNIFKIKKNCIKCSKKYIPKEAIKPLISCLK